MSGPVRCDRLTAPYWRNVPVSDRERIEAAIPDGHAVTVLARHGIRDWTIRLMADTGNPTGHAVYREVARVERARALLPAIEQVLAMRREAV